MYPKAIFYLLEGDYSCRDPLSHSPRSTSKASRRHGEYSSFRLRAGAQMAAGPVPFSGCLCTVLGKYFLIPIII